MPSNRTRRKRIQKNVVPLEPTIIEVLLFGTAASGTPGESLRVSRFFDGGAHLRSVWNYHKDFLLAEWEKLQGQGRPWAQEWIDRNMKGRR